MDEGLPIAYAVLEKGVPVYASDGGSVGVVDHVVMAPAEDIFHGIVMRTGTTQRFIAAEQVGALHEHGVDLKIDAAATTELPSPHGAAPAWRAHEPGVKPSRWKELLGRATGERPHKQDWTAED